MRTKVEIIKTIKDNVDSHSIIPTLHNRIELLKLEVIIDIRNILEYRLLEIDRDLDKILDALKK